MTINIENFKLARQWVAECEEFDMSCWIRPAENSCGSASCIGGTIEFNLYGGYAERFEVGAADWLGLSIEQEEMLFYNSEYYYGITNHYRITKQMALDKLDAIIEAGKFV